MLHLLSLEHLILHGVRLLLRRQCLVILCHVKHRWLRLYHVDIKRGLKGSLVIFLDRLVAIRVEPGLEVAVLLSSLRRVLDISLAILVSAS